MNTNSKRAKHHHAWFRRTFLSIRVYCWSLLLFPFTAVAHEITVFNFSGGNVTATPLTFPVGQSTFTWPYMQTNWVFTYRGVNYSLPVTQDFQLLIDRNNVYQTLVLSTTEWFFLGFGLAMTIGGFFWIVRIVNQLMKPNPEVP